MSANVLFVVRVAFIKVTLISGIVTVTIDVLVLVVVAAGGGGSGGCRIGDGGTSTEQCCLAMGAHVFSEGNLLRLQIFIRLL